MLLKLLAKLSDSKEINKRIGRVHSGAFLQLVDSLMLAWVELFLFVSVRGFSYCQFPTRGFVQP